MFLGGQTILMLDPDKIAEMEQTVAAVKETIPKLVKAIQEGFKAEGYSDSDARLFAIAYLFSFNGKFN